MTTRRASWRATTWPAAWWSRTRRSCTRGGRRPEPRALCRPDRQSERRRQHVCRPGPGQSAEEPRRRNHGVELSFLDRAGRRQLRRRPAERRRRLHPRQHVRQGRDQRQPAIIHFGGEIDNPSGSLLVEHNNFSSNLEHTTAVLNQTDLPVQVIDNALTGVENIVWGSGPWRQSDRQRARSVDPGRHGGGSGGHGTGHRFLDADGYRGR